MYSLWLRSGVVCGVTLDTGDATAEWQRYVFWFLRVEWDQLHVQDGSQICCVIHHRNGHQVLCLSFFDTLKNRSAILLHTWMYPTTTPPFTNCQFYIRSLRSRMVIVHTSREQKTWSSRQGIFGLQSSVQKEDDVRVCGCLCLVLYIRRFLCVFFCYKWIHQEMYVPHIMLYFNIFNCSSIKCPFFCPTKTFKPLQSHS